ncbi:hypothetical protein GGI35DRAFT_368385 [Trichoderma velutinum]
MPTSPLLCTLSTKTCGKDRLFHYWPLNYRPTSFTSFGGVADAGAIASSREPSRSTIVMNKLIFVWDQDVSLARGDPLQLNVASVSPLLCDNICHSDHHVWCFRQEGAKFCATQANMAQGGRPC